MNKQNYYVFFDNNYQYVLISIYPAFDYPMQYELFVKKDVKLSIANYIQ